MIVFNLAERVPEKIGWNTYLRTLGKSRFPSEKKNLGQPPRVLYIARQICHFSRTCYLVMFHETRYFVAFFHYPSGYPTY